MKLSSLSRAAVCLAGGLVRLGLGARLPHSSLMQIVEDVDGGMELGHIDQPQYTLFLDEDDMHMEQRYEGLHKRGYYTCYNRQVYTELHFRLYQYCIPIPRSISTDILTEATD